MVYTSVDFTGLYPRFRSQFHFRLQSFIRHAVPTFWLRRQLGNMFHSISHSPMIHFNIISPSCVTLWDLAAKVMNTNISIIITQPTNALIASLHEKQRKQMQDMLPQQY